MKGGVREGEEEEVELSEIKLEREREKRRVFGRLPPPKAEIHGITHPLLKRQGEGEVRCRNRGRIQKQMPKGTIRGMREVEVG